MRGELKELQRRTGITFVYVTHDQAEAMALSDRIAVMHLGELMQVGAPREVYTRPANRIVADFMGLVTLIPGRVVRAGDEGLVAIGEHRVALALAPSLAEGQAVQLAIRPESVHVAPLATGGVAAPAAVTAKVAEVTFLGNLVDCYAVMDDGTRVRIQADAGTTLEVGQRVAVELDTRAATVFAA